ncbi:hypothetical protein [Mycolicibacterium palauense]|uniref:hypothetical protein n=1 Tax=Mycolicibacterium palauense TaxID=2034511 RepID=UPI000BFEF96F|nr:hypothetical protein [Mycolicibacterium palauense]
MPAPSVSFDTEKVKPIWKGRLSLEDVKGCIAADVAELQRLYSLQAEDERKCATDQYRTPDYQLHRLIAGWEHAQDTHWSWYREMMNVGAAATKGA